MATGLPSNVALEIEFTAGVWTDVGASTDSAVIRRGRDSQFTDIQPGTLTFTLENIDGTFTPDNPLSTYYPNLVEGKRIRCRVTKSATTYTRFLGKIASIDPRLDGDLAKSTTTIVAKDALGQLQDMNLRSALTMQVLSLNPVAFYPLDEPAGATKASNVVPGSAAPALAVRSTGRGGSLVFGDSGSGPGVDGQTAPRFTAADAQNGWYLLSESDFAYATIGNLSFECWFAADEQAAAGSVDDHVIAMLETKRNAASAVAADDYVFLYYKTDHFTATDPVDEGHGGAHSSNAYGSGAFLGVDQHIADGALHHLVYTESTSAGIVTQKLYVDGSLWATNTYLTSALPPVDLKLLQVGGQYGVTGYRFNGVVAGVAVYTGALSAGQVADNYAAGMPVAAGDTLDRQLSRLTAWTGITIVLDTPSGRAAVLGKTLDRSGLDVLLEIVRGESGYVYHDYIADQVVVRHRSSVRKTTVALTVDAIADMDGEPTFVRNSADRVAIGLGKSPTSTQTAIDATLEAAIGPVTGEVDTTLGDDVELQSVASDRISRGRDVALRVKGITVDLMTAQNDLYASFFALLPGDRIRVGSVPTSHLGVTRKDGYAQGWTETIATDGYVVDLDLSDADGLTEGVWDTARWAFGDGVCTVTGGTAVGGTGTGTITLTWAAAVALSTVAGNYPMDFNWNGERVTVTAAPAGGTSPRTLTITARGVAPTVARVHSAGEPIDVWDAGRWAL